MKKILIFSIVTILSFAFTNTAKSQTEDFKTKYDLAEGMMNDGNYTAALQIFLSLDSIKPQNSNINFQIGMCYINSTSDQTKAIPYFEMAKKNVSKKYTGGSKEDRCSPYVFYYLAKAYHLDYNLDKAIEYFNKFKEYFNYKTDRAIVEQADRQIEMCNNAKKSMADAGKLKIENLGPNINSPYRDYSPVISLDGSTLIFTSRRKVGENPKKEKDGRYFEDIYISKYNSETKQWDQAKSIGDSINTNLHEASISLSADGKQLFLYKSDGKDGNIYVSKNIDGNWSSPQKLPEPINSKAWETHVFLTTDGNTLYFVSDRSGGFGGRDIYSSKKISEGVWDKPINLGPVINTKYEEESPYIVTDSSGTTLYFSSKGQGSIGGFDIFTSKQKIDGTWSEPKSMIYPINTSDDDVFYVPTQDKKHAYYASGKYGGLGDLDLYYVTILNEGKADSTKIDTIVTQPVDTAKIVKNVITPQDTVKNIVVIPQDTVKNVVITQVDTNKLNIYTVQVGAGNMNLSYFSKVKDYEIKLNKKDLLKRFIVGRFTNKEEAFTFRQKMVFLGYEDAFVRTISATNDIDVGEGVIMRNVYFENTTLKPESNNEINKFIDFLKLNPSFVIEISCHTDNTGDAATNTSLTDSRAKSVTEYIVSKGIEPSRLSYKGYGSKKPFATNSTVEGRKTNCRTEYCIIKK
ncbi:MAG: PD40 domain-containing protein [Bacteroidetes bacterium]|nr:PD40 domain-containing protein [Bacteroidota bacterium]